MNSGGTESAGRDEGPDGGPEPEWSPEDAILDDELRRAFARAKGDPASTVEEHEHGAADLLVFFPEGLPAAGLGRTPGRWLEAGDRLGRFVVVKELGRGGFGVVYLAEDPRLRQPVALKIPRPDLVQNVALWAGLAREARVAAPLQHPGIVRVYQAGVIDDTFHIASEYERGEDLAAWLARHPGGVPYRVAAESVRRLADALAYAHARNVVHRDVKPANVLVVDDLQEFPRLKITDFGLGLLMESILDDRTLTGHWQGTAPYMAPEQLACGQARIGREADVYALGAILYEMLTGRLVHPARSLLELHAVYEREDPPAPMRRLRPGIPADLETLTMACLERDPESRPTAIELCDELDRYQRGLPIRRRPLAWPVRTIRYARRRPSHAALVAVTAASLAGLAALSVRLTRSNRELREALVGQGRAYEAQRGVVYSDSLRQAARDIRDGRVESAQERLDQVLPGPGEADLREFAWRLLRALATSDHRVERFSDLSWWDGPKDGLADEPGDWRSKLWSAGFIDVGPSVLQYHQGAGIRRLDGRSWGLQRVDAGRGERLALEQAGRRRPLPLSTPGPFRLGADGGTLVISAPDPADPDRTPGPLEVGSVDLPLDDGESPRQLRVLTAPASSSIEMSADGTVLAALAIAQETDRVFPIFYEIDPAGLAGPGGGRRVGHPSRLRPREHAWTGDELPHPVHYLRGAVVLSPDGSLAAMTGWEPRLEVFEAWTGRTLWTLGPDDVLPDMVCFKAAFSPDGLVLATGTSGGTVQVRDARTGRKINEFKAGPNRINGLGFHPDAATVAVTIENEDRIRFWRYEPGPPNPRPLDVPARDATPPEIWGVGFARGGAWLLACDDENRLLIVDRAAGEAEPRVVLGPTGMMSLSVHPGGRRAAVLDYDGGLHLVDLDGPARLERVGTLGAKGRALAWSPGGETLAAAGKSPRVLLHGGVPDRFLETPHFEVYSLAWSRDGRLLAVGGHDDRAVSLWDFPAGTLRAVVPIPGRPSCLAFSPAGDRLVVGDAEGRLISVDPSGAEEPRVLVDRASEEGGVWAVAFSLDGRTLASGGDDRLVRLWDPASGRDFCRLEGHGAKVHALAFGPDGETLASGDFQGRILLWSALPREESAG